MSMPMPGPDARTALISELGLDRKSFKMSNLIFKNGKALKAIEELGKIKGELMSIARDPGKGIEQLGNPPKKPDVSKLSPEEAERVENDYMQQLGVYNMAAMALTQHVPPEDMMAINNWLEPYIDEVEATPSVKGKRFFALTKPIEDNPEGLGAMFGRGKNG